MAAPAAPSAFPPGPTIYGHMRFFLRDGVWDSIRHHVVVMLREEAVREPTSIAAMLDTQSVKPKETSDTLIGAGGSDQLDDGPGIDTVSYAGSLLAVIIELEQSTASGGDTSGDIIVGNAGTDGVFGEDGNDKVNVGEGNDTVLGGEGDDEIGLGSGNDVSIGQGGNDTIVGEAGDDRINSGDGNDIILGGDGDDEIDGGIGNDDLQGGAGRDVIFGESGMDFFTRGSGDDLLIGGGDSDIFVFWAHHGFDVITDFTVGSDNILLQSTGIGSFADLMNTRNIFLGQTMSSSILDPAACNYLETTYPASMHPISCSRKGGRAAIPQALFSRRPDLFR